MKDVVIVSGVRTAIGAFGGSLKDFSASDLGGIAIREAVKRAGIAPEQVDEVAWGCVGQIAEDAFVSRLASVKAGIPVEATAITVNRLCSSGLQSIVTAAMEISCDFAEIVVAGGSESMSNIPYYLRNARFGYRMGHGEFEDGLVTALSDPFTRSHMGITAENVAEKYHVTRDQQDQFALESQQKAAKGIAGGLFKDEIVPVKVKVSKTEEKTFDTDEHPRKTTPESLAKLRPAFKKDGTVTAGNASGVNDAGAAVVVMTAQKAVALGLKPIVRLVDAAAAGVPPEIMGIGPVPAVKKLLKKTGVKLNDIGVIELNEAFASQSLACINELGLNPCLVNVNGGAIALGHPIGASGCIITIKLINEMVRRKSKYGMSTLCIGGGQGLAVLFELC
ncbi:MAG: acetyl-CoA C-acetyltransferase [Candidatus Korobacteraceae bacterium]|jgi:acetyl-CoA C-acetyltransferase